MRHHLDLLRLPGRRTDQLPVPERSTSLPGATVPGPRLLRQDVPSWARPPREIPFDVSVIIAAPASGTTTTLVGAGATASLGAVPPGYRGFVDGISPYLEDATGPLTTPRIPGVGVTITWRLFVSNQPAPYYGRITTLLDGWSDINPRSLLELRETETLTANVTIVDPGGLYAFLGLRLRGRWVPWMDRQ